MFANALRQTLAVLGLAEDSADVVAPAPVLAITGLDLNRPADAFEALRRIAGQAEESLDLAA